MPHFIGHENGWFKVPVLRDIAARFQVIPSRRPEETVRELRRGGFLLLYPGSNREAAMRSYRDEPYRLKWEGCRGFLRLALEADAEIVFVAAATPTRSTARCAARSAGSSAGACERRGAGCTRSVSGPPHTG